jgi:hypothetical protein
MEFEIDERLEQPFKLEMITPSGRFQPLHSAQVKLDGPPSGSMVLTIRGTLGRGRRRAINKKALRRQSQSPQVNGYDTKGERDSIKGIQGMW